MPHLIPLFLGCLCLSSFAYAQTDMQPSVKPDLPHYSPILPVHIQPRQAGADSMSKAAADVEQQGGVDADSFGLMARESEGSLGGNVWKDYTSQTLIDDLSHLNLNIRSPALRSLLIRALLTAPDTGSFPDDKNSDVFSARLATLAELGSYDETVKLYKKLEGNIPSDTVALAGVEAIVGNGQMGLACLEEKALSENLKNNKGNNFWPDLKSFCKILLKTNSTGDETASLAEASKAYVAMKKYHAPARLEELNGKSVVEILVLNKAGLISSSLFTYDSVRSLKPQLVSLLLKQNTIPAAEKLTLLAASVDLGLKTADEFETEFLTEAKAPALTTGSWQPILMAYNKVLTSSKEQEKILLLKPVLTARWPDSSLIPFAKFFVQRQSLDEFTKADAITVVSALVRLGKEVPVSWFIKAFPNQAGLNTESVSYQDIVSRLEKGQNGLPDATEQQPDQEQAQKGKKLSDNEETLEKAQFHAIFLMLGDEEAEDKTEEKSYEKLLNLTGTNDYVMPSKELMNNLNQASLGQDIGKVILYSLKVLNGQRVSQIHPAALYGIYKGLQSVGLSEEAKSLGQEALADLIEHKKE